jgi:hypothetical protein
MKRILFSCLMLAAFIIQSCDYVEVPQQTVNSGGPDSEQVVRKVLVEDYTGHTCGNCPGAAATVQQLMTTYGEQVIPIAVHAGYFADPAAAPYTDDFRTAAGTAYDNFFGISAIGNPNGMVNRINFPSAQHIKDYHTWGGYVDSLLQIAPEVNIKITNTYDNNTRQLSTNIETKFLAAQSGTYKVVVLITEDSIVSPQKDYNQTPSDILTYTHRHMLRDAINSTWGDTVATGTINAGTLSTKSYVYNGITSHALWIPSRCYVVAYVYDALTYQVLQAEEKRVK